MPGFILSAAAAMTASAASMVEAGAPMTGDSAADPIVVAMLSYGPSLKTGRCFSDSFLSVVARETSIRVRRVMASVPLDSDELAGHPFAVMTGEGSFELSDAEVANLRRHLLSGGFLLASAGCSNSAWAASMERALERALPESPPFELPLDHPVFHSLFDIQDFISRRRQPVRMMGVEVGGRLAVLYSPQGLNDTNEVGGLAPDGRAWLPEATSNQRATGCCCCGGDEIISAKFINANALVYALVQ